MTINSTSVFKAGTIFSGLLPVKLRNSLRYRFISNINVSGQVLHEVHPQVFLKLDLSDWLQKLYYLGFTEDNIFKIIKELLPVGGTFVDVGANVGLFTCVLAHHIGANGSVIAFEPMKENLVPLYNNINLNKLENIEVKEVALSNTPREFNLYVPQTHSQGSTGCTQVWNPGDWLSIGNTTATTLDLIFQNQRLDFVKIDTQGHELEILEGAKSTIQQYCPYIFCEISQENRKQVFELVKAWDYAIFSPTRDGFLNDSIAPSGWVDVFLIPRQKIEVIKHLLK